MKTTKIFLVLGLLLLIVSCSKETDEPRKLVGLNIDEGVHITLIDQNGNDLLDPSNQGAFYHSGIRIFHMVNGKKTEYYNNMLDYPRGCRIYEPGDLLYNNYFVFALMRTSSPENTTDPLNPITYIQWDENDTDTLKSEIVKFDATTFCSKVWCNGTLVWDVETTDSSGRSFDLIKQK